MTELRRNLADRGLVPNTFLTFGLVNRRLLDMSSLLSSAILLVTCPLCSQFQTKLEPGTIAAFAAHVKTVEEELAGRWNDQAPFVSLDSDRESHQKLLRGDLLIKPANSPNPLEVPNGLVHDWVGAVYIPRTSADRVVSVLQDFNNHSKIYPEVVRSRLIKHDGTEIAGYWRLERKQQFVPAVFDVEQVAHYKQLAPGKWICQAYSTSIREVNDAGSAKESDYPAGEGLGLLWKLDAYWSIEAIGNGVIAECRTISLSRSIPSGMGWMIKPFIQNVPRESLASTLKNTRRTLQ